MDTKEALLLRADLLQLVKGLELQRAAVLSIVARLEKEYNIEKGTGNGRSKSTPVHNQNESGEHIENKIVSMLHS